ncbi:MAG: hypothetical protein WDM96_02965, partial [Lacunisphaera sp.]
MNFWTLLLVGAGAIQAIGLVAFLVGLLRAPAGFQDEAGFHLTAVSDVGAGAAQEPAVIDTGEDTLPPFGHAA